MHVQSFEEVNINFNQDALFGLNIALALVMFGVALHLDWDDFKALKKQPRAALVGIISQYFLLPALTFGLIWLIQPHPMLSLGMILVAACPGGNVSNFFTQLSGGNVALSVALSMLSTLTAFIITPLQIAFWGSLMPETATLLAQVDISFWQMIKIVSIILIFPVMLGIFTKRKAPQLALKIRKPLRIFSFLVLMGIIIGGLSANLSIFQEYYDRVVYLVLLHNGLAHITAAALALLLGLKAANVKTISMETATQNSGLGLVLIFNFFDGNGPMAIIAAWWGIWHIISGFSLSQLYKHWKTALV